jgi:hypothetical protein
LAPGDDPNTRTTASRSAFAASMTTRIGLLTSRPRSRSPTSNSVTTVVFSVSPLPGQWAPSAVNAEAVTTTSSDTSTAGIVDQIHSQGDDRLSTAVVVLLLALLIGAVVSHYEKP